MNSKLYDGNLGPNVSEAEIRALFSPAGAVTAVELMLEPTSGQSRGYGFVTKSERFRINFVSTVRRDPWDGV